MWQAMVFFLGALFIAGLSWRYLTTIRTYGFFRFLSFEALWAVTVINLPRWSFEVSSASQIFSWALILGFLCLVIVGSSLLLTAGRPSPMEPPALFRRPSRLVTSGPYRYVRHPLYLSLMLLAWGETMRSVGFFSIVFSLLTTGALYITALLEEEENLDRFGGAYAEYMTITRMFVPGVI